MTVGTFLVKLIGMVGLYIFAAVTIIISLLLLINTPVSRGIETIKNKKEERKLVREKLEENFQNVTNWLLQGNIDFDYICESILPDQCAAGGAPLRVGEMAYDAVVVPACETLRSTTLERLEAFRAAGGKLLFITYRC